jgi:hypothetical protein
MSNEVVTEVKDAVQAAENEGLAVEDKVEATVQADKSRVLAAIAGLEAHIQTIEKEVVAFTEHERAAVQQYLLSLKTRVHSLLLRL